MISKLGSGGSKFGAGGGSGSVDWTSTQTSDVTDGASVNAFDFDTTNSISTGNLVAFSNNGTQILSIDDSGNFVVDSGDISYYVSSARPNVRFTRSIDQAALYGNSGSAVLFGGTTFSTTGFHLCEDGINFASGNTNSEILIQIGARNTSTASRNIKIQGQDFTDGSTAQTNNVKGGGIVLQGGDPAPSATGADGGDITMTAGSASGTGTAGQIIMSGLPTSDPTVAGALWNDTGTLKVSAG